MRKQHLTIAGAALSVAGVAIAFGGLSAAVVGTSSDQAEGQAPASAQPRDRGTNRVALSPVVSRGAVSFKDRSIPVRADVTSVGTSRGGLVITETDNGLGNVVHVHDTDGDPVIEADAVKGIAISDPAGTRAAWVEYTSRSDEGGSQVVTVDVASGRILGRAPVAELARVTAVSGRDVAMSDGDQSFLWSPEAGLTRLTFVPDDYYVVALDAERVVASDLNSTTTIFTRSGSRTGNPSGLISWDLNGAGRLVGATEDGSLKVIDPGSGTTTTTLRPPFHAVSASWTSEGTVVATSRAALTGTGHGYAWCTLSNECSALLNGGTPYAPNDAVGQLVAQSR
ncbi:MAG: hypothetical protein ACRDPR_09105 [Nocardioidaceae bacterium]